MPDLLIIAGPNGAGKTTFATEYLSAEFAGVAFVNADEIGRALRAAGPNASEITAARLPSPLVGEGGSRRSRETDEGC